MSDEIAEEEEFVIEYKDLPSACTDKPDNLCSINIGVFSDPAYDSSQFSLLVTWNRINIITELLDGVP